MSALIIAHAIGVVGGLMAVTYQGVAESKRWPIGAWFYGVTWVTLTAFGTLLWSALAPFLFWSIAGGFGLLVASFGIAALLTFALRSGAQFASLLLMVGSWAIRVGNLLIP